jgi:NADPH2:quinone reductase
MIALQFARFGEPTDVPEPVEIPAPEPAVAWASLKLVRSPIHNHDLSIVRGRYGVKPPLPAIAGSELLGTVERLGEGVSHLAIGQRIATTIAFGAWAEYVVVPASGCVPIPDALHDDVACQLLAMPLSALVLLDELRVEPGDWIVQNAAGGAVGKLVQSIAASRGVNVVNLVRRESAAEELRATGAAHVVATEHDDWAKRVAEFAGSARFARVIDSVCDDTAISLQRLLGKHGEYVIFGALGASALRLDPGAFIFNEIVTRGFWMTAWITRASAAQRETALKSVFELALGGNLPLHVAGVYPLRDGRAAVTAAERPGRQGKVLLAPG